MNMKNLLWPAVILGLVAVSIAMMSPGSKGWIQSDESKYIKFSHKFHLSEVGAECDVCHHDARTSKLSSDDLIGDHESCKSCHEEQISSACATCHVDTSDIEPIPNPKRDLFFSHERHVSGNVKCTDCHAGLEGVTYATDANFPSMDACINCHGSRKVSVECATCHMDHAGLIPADHLAGDFKKDHRKLTRIGGLNVACSACHSESFCQDCHSGIELKGFGFYRDLMGDPSPRMPLRDSPKELKLQQAHDLNYRYTHAVDAKSKQTDCYVCHERQTFCVECHQAGGNINQGKIKPANHSEAGFKTIGKGSGGGRHAQLARRDIEYCASCHDVEGADPTCLLCHDENGGVR